MFASTRAHDDAQRLRPPLLSRVRASTLFALLFSFSFCAFAQPVPTPAEAPNATATPEPVAKKSWPATGARLRLKQSPRKPARGYGTFLQPLRFDPEDNNLSIDNPQLKWFTTTDQDRIDLGGLKIDESMIGFAIDQIPRDQATARYDDRNRERTGESKSQRYFTTLSFHWPTTLLKVGELTIESLEGKVAWTIHIGNEERKAWKDELAFATDAMKANHVNSEWGIFDIERPKFAFLMNGKPFRACFIQEVSEAEHLRICSAPFTVKTKGELVRMFPPKNLPPVDAGFFGEGKKLAPTGLLNFTFGKPIVLKMVFAGGAMIEIASQPADPKLLDVVQSPDGKEIILTGAGAKPLGNRVRVIQKPVTHFWAPTGVSQERIWQVAIPRDSPTVRVIGAYGIPFTLLFAFDRLPKEADRVFVEQTRSSGTYSSAPLINGFIPSAGEVTSQEFTVKKLDAYHFAWKFAAPNADAENRATILVKSTESPRPWVAHHRMYRTYPYEVSARLAGVLQQDSTLIILGEISAAGWFETIGGWQNKWLSKQRWGLASRYFQSLSNIQTTAGSSVSTFSVLNVDLKYNFLPGIWHRDELFGATLSMEQVQLASVGVNLLGAGLYWARTMPKIFDQLFNLVPIFDFPKYVDMEFIFYPASITPNTAGGLTYALNFHGRVFWTRRIYGESGFGLRRYQFTVPRPANPGKMSTLDLTTTYGNVGLGIVF